jgi:hypothetical protein
VSLNRVNCDPSDGVDLGKLFATLHELVQIAFDWSDFHLHRFLIRGKEYGLSQMGCTTFRTEARKVLLSEFYFRVNERFLYEYDLGDLWRHQLRFEGIQPIREKKIYPVCVGGTCASPLEDCGGPEAYMEKMDHHRWNPPLDELQLIADGVGRVLESQGARGSEMFSATSMLCKKQLIDWRPTNGSALTVLIDERSTAGSSSMRKAITDGAWSRGRRR